MIFYFVAFYGRMPGSHLILIMFTQYGLKSGWEIVAAPLTYRVVAFLKRAEQEDYYDIGTNFTPFSLHRPRRHTLPAAGAADRAAAAFDPSLRHILPSPVTAGARIAARNGSSRGGDGRRRMSANTGGAVMKTAYSKVVVDDGIDGDERGAWADSALADRAEDSPAAGAGGIRAGAVIGGFAAGPIGAVVGAGLGTWLGIGCIARAMRPRRRRRSPPCKATGSSSRRDRGAQERDARRSRAPRATWRRPIARLTARLDQLAHSVETAQEANDDAAREQAARVLDGLQGDVLFRTGSAEITQETAA